MMGKAVAVGAAALVIAFGTAGPASAEAQHQASCIGFEASGIAPPGSSDEFPGGMAQLQEYLRSAVGHPTGLIVSDVAHLQLGSHEACDAAG
ncbi:hypothetical protein [Terrabacter sp. MAHUQ-38]|uniref:hypothetical protein n=1 Tax=unclassified Terrabacter TaxID=2630222 RepID=UPI00165D61BE|nr:hypothetical protein [Terrabacter sp. MAHUQ-38]MBC9820689.1 hypothetical protein [Terrabacter sp. MAHUQ-38]